MNFQSKTTADLTSYCQAFLQHAYHAAAWSASFVMLVAVWSSPASGQGLVYQDADIIFVNGVDNLNPADGSDFVDTFNGVFSSPAADDLWDIRGPEGYDPIEDVTIPGDMHGARPAGSTGPPDEQSVYASGGRGQENAKELVQTLSGLANSTSYDVYAVYWTADNADWGVRAGFTSSPGANPYFNFSGNDPTDGTITVPATAGSLASSAVWSLSPGTNSDPGLYSEGNRLMLIAKVGTQSSNSSGQLDVYIDDLSTTELGAGSALRTHYDGLAYVAAGTSVIPTATLNRDTGVLSISSPAAVASYAIGSESGGLNPGSWNSIATGSNGSLDSDPWVESSRTDLLLEEAETPANNGVSFTGSISLGSVWQRSPFEDTTVTLTLTDATEIVVPIEYTGATFSEPFAIGDLNTDGSINVSDYQILISNLHAPIDTLTDDTALEQYLLGDLNGDVAVNYSDLVQFRNLFAAANPGVSLSAALVPEPSAFVVLGCLLFGMFIFSSRSSRKHVAKAKNKRTDHSSSALSAVRRNASWLLIWKRTCLCSLAAAMVVTGDSRSEGQDLFYNVQFGNQPSQSADYMPELVTTFVAPGLSGSSGVDIGNNETVDDNGSTQIFANDQPASNAITGGPIRVEQNPGFNGGDGNAIEADDFDIGYFQIDVSANIGTFDLSNLTFEAQRATTGTTQRGFELFVETDGTAFDFATSTQLLNIDNEPTNRNTGPTTYDVDLSGIDFQGVSSVAFRFFQTADSTGGMEFGNISLFGSNVDTSALSLEVDRSTGEITVLNTGSSNVSFDYYEIRSDSDSLNFSNWNSLDDQESEPDPFNSGWDEAGGSSDSILSEVRGIGEGDETVTAGIGELSLGNAFDIGGSEDLTFFYSLDNGTLLAGEVDYIGASTGTPGDFDNDNDVDGADFLAWQRGEAPGGATPANLADWQSNYGTNSTVVASSAVPEPTTFTLILSAGLLCMPRSRRQAKLMHR